MSETLCVLYFQCTVLGLVLTLSRGRRQRIVAGVGLGTSVGRAGLRLKLYPTLGTGLATVKPGRPGNPTCTCGAIHPVINDNKVGLGDVPGHGMGVRAVVSEGTTVSLARRANKLFARWTTGVRAECLGEH
jgi:hypothetical protein